MYLFFFTQLSVKEGRFVALALLGCKSVERNPEIGKCAERLEDTTDE